MKVFKTSIYLVLLFLLNTNIILGQNKWSGNDNITDSIYRLGNVGIGIGASDCKLTVSHNSYMVAEFLNSDTTNNHFAIYHASNALPASIFAWVTSINHSNGAFGIGRTIDGDNDPNTDDYGWYGQDIAIDTLGNIGIGTSFPEGKLDVKGKVITNELEVNGCFTVTDLVVSDKLGIGTASPSAKLHVIDGFIMTGNTTTNPVGFRAGENYPLVSEAKINGHGDAAIFHNATITNENNLDVYKYVTASANFGSRGIKFSYINGITFYADRNLATAGTTFTPTPVMNITNSGNVGIGIENLANAKLQVAGNTIIGTTTTAADLTVNGKITATEVVVQLDVWSDFVFEKDYNLPSIEEVEQHIKINKHLPGIPSAKEVEVNGVALGEMQTKLLQKIEELTLYMIKQDKTIKTLQNEVTQLKNN